jgi:hypothetical protein
MKSIQNGMTKLAIPNRAVHAQRPIPREAPPARRQGAVAVAFASCRFRTKGLTPITMDDTDQGGSEAFGPGQDEEFWCGASPHDHSSLRFE